MSDTLNHEDIISTVYQLLSTTELFQASHRQLITDIFNGNNRRDMTLNIELGPQAHLYMLERSTVVWECHTDRRDIVIYASILSVLDRIITAINDSLFRDSQGTVHYSSRVVNHRRQLMQQAFDAIGGQYLKWHNQGISLWKVAQLIP